MFSFFFQHVQLYKKGNGARFRLVFEVKMGSWMLWERSVLMTFCALCLSTIPPRQAAANQRFVVQFFLTHNFRWEACPLRISISMISLQCQVSPVVWGSTLLCSFVHIRKMLAFKCRTSMSVPHGCPHFARTISLSRSRIRYFLCGKSDICPQAVMSSRPISPGQSSGISAIRCSFTCPKPIPTVRRGLQDAVHS